MPIASILATVLFCGGLIAVALVLGRYRDRLQRKFNTNGGITVRASANLGDGARLCVVEVEGTKVLCGMGRSGITTMLRLEGSDIALPPALTASAPEAPARVKEPFVMPPRPGSGS